MKYAAEYCDCLGWAMGTLSALWEAGMRVSEEENGYVECYAGAENTLGLGVGNRTITASL